MPLKPQRVYEEMNKAFGRDTCYVTHHRPLADRRRAVPARLQAAQLDQLRPGRPAWAGRIPAALGVRAADPTRKIVALSGDYDFQFMIEELAVGAQYKLPYLHVVVNNSYLGLIRQSQRGFEMDFCVQSRLREHQRAPERCEPATASITWRWSKAWAARRSACTSPNEIAGSLRRRPAS